MAQKTRHKVKKQKFVVQTNVLIGAICAALAAILAVVLHTFDSNDPSWFYYSSEQPAIKNALGKIGCHISAALFYSLGAACYLIVPILLGLAWIAWTEKSLKYHIDRFAAAMVGIVSLSTLFYVYRVGSIGYMIPGGIVGQTVHQWLRLQLDPMVTTTSLWLALFAAVIVVSRMSFLTIFDSFFKAVHYLVAHWRHWLVPILYGFQLLLQGLFIPIKWFFIGIKRLLQGTDITESDESVFSFEQGDQKEEQFEQEEFWQGYIGRQEHSHSGTAASIKPEVDQSQDAESETIKEKRNVQPDQTETRTNYSAPQPTLFDAPEKEACDTRNDQNKQLAQALEEKLLRFGVTGTVTKIKPGPVITLFEYQPDIDAKVSKIQGLESDLALALEAMSVRIIAPIPGTSLVGFEVANKERRDVFLRDIVRSSTFQKTRALLPIILGKDTAGDNVVVDLADMPHLLVAGSTGSGKSVALNTLLVSVLCKLRPDELKLIIIDPKRLEFSAYQDVPHLLFPIITQPSKAAPVLRWLVRVMEERYEMMAQLGARSIGDYKQMCKKEGKQDELPYIILMIDELADLMMVARRDVEDSIARLAQMARAAGIHLVVATQRPSVDVLTGVIKVNFPSRMSFRVTSKVDSRTVLDALGAETLLGKGDMLFMDSHSARMRRIHGAYVTDAEINRIVNHIKAQQKVEYTSLEEAVAAYNQDVAQVDEPLLPEVIAYLQTIDEISISSLQRRFKIGYNRSARMIEMLEGQGRIMPSSGGKMRKVIH
jgi:S-DNA-T family DNA segregation ATPase FtsK/SpoIIIE